MFKFLFSFVLVFPVYSQCFGTGCVNSGGGSGVTSFNARTGVVVPVFSDYPIVSSSPVGAPTYNILAADEGKLLTNTNATVLNLPTCATVGSGWFVYMMFPNTPIIFTNASETIDGFSAATYSGNVTVYHSVVLFITDGTKWITTLTRVPLMVGASSSAAGVPGFTASSAIGDQDLPLTGGAVYATSTVGRFTAQTAAKTVLTATSTVAADQTYLISTNINVTVATAHSFTATVTYTDETNTSRTQTLPFVALAGTTLTTITNVTGAGPYEGVPIHIRCKANTTIVIATVGTFTTVTYNVEAHIRHIK